MKIKRLAFSLVSLVCCLAMVACSGINGKENSGDGASVSSNNGGIPTVNLAYSSKDVLNPFTAKTKQNQELSKLLYDPLVKLNDSFEAENYIASEIKQNGTVITVKLKSIKFSDGTVLSADDVVYSLKQATADGSNYESKLFNISNFYALDSSTVIIETGYADKHFASNLDFPIIKSGTASLKNENNLSVAPIGCGRYTLSYDNGVYTLNANRNYYNGDIKLECINLINCPDDDSLSHYMSIGKISMVYSDLSDSVIPKLAGKSIKTASTSLVYIGVNSNYGSTSNVKVRLAVSFGIDRVSISSNAYFDYATPATSLYPSVLPDISGLESIDSKQNKDQAIAYLNDLGYNRTDDLGYYINDSGERLKLSLLYNSENAAREAAAKQIVNQLKKCGIEVDPVAADFSEYQSLLSSGDFDLYIGEVKLSNSLDVMPIFDKRDIIYGIPYDCASYSAFKEYYNGDSDVLSAISCFVSEMPFIPVCYRNGVVIASDTVAQHLSPYVSDIYNNIENVN